MLVQTPKLSKKQTNKIYLGLTLIVAGMLVATKLQHHFNSIPCTSKRVENRCDRENLPWKKISKRPAVLKRMNQVRKQRASRHSLECKVVLFLLIVIRKLNRSRIGTTEPNTIGEGLFDPKIFLFIQITFSGTMPDALKCRILRHATEITLKTATETFGDRRFPAMLRTQL